MELKPEDHLKEISCYIEDVFIKKGLIYLEDSKYFIFQDYKSGTYPDSWAKIKKNGINPYQYSWICQRDKGTIINLKSSSVRVSNLKFLGQTIYELW